MISVRSKLITTIVTVVAVAFIHPGAASEAESKSLPNLFDNQQLVSELRNGGYILYFRHGMTDHSTFDTDRENLGHCASQRLLSDEGRAQMRDVGDAIRQLGIKIGTVESSPYCRSIDTADMAFGRMQVVQMLRHTVTASEAVSKKQAKALRERLSRNTEKPGYNAVLSSHTANLQEAVGIWPSPEGVAIIFKPDGVHGAKYIATVPPTRWMELAELYKETQ